MVSCRLLPILLLLATGASGGGLIVYRDANGLSFADAITLAVNGKDKALNLGEKPQAAGPVNKLPPVRLTETLLKDATAGVVAVYAKSSPVRYLYPDGLSKKVPVSPADGWKESKITYKKSQSEKAAVDLPAGQFVAFLPGGIQELAELCMDPNALQVIGGKDGAFPAQLELTAAAVAAYGSNPAMAAVERQVGEFLRQRCDRFDKGIESAASLNQGLQFARLSEKAYPALSEHQRYRKLLAEKKAWLDQRVAILRALAAGEQWDAFLVAYRDFEKHQSSFPELMQKQHQAMKESLDTHWKSGRDRLARGEFRRAFGELRLASVRQPSNAPLQKELGIAWTEYSRQVAVDQRMKRKQLSLGEREAINQSLHFASRYKEQKKLDEALKSVQEAERIDPQSLPMLLAKAEILGARNELAQALATLDVYDQQAVDEERAAGAKLRNELLFQLTDRLKEVRNQLAASWNGGRFYQTLTTARQGLQVNESDGEVLYYAGLASLATRDSKNGVALLRKYLEVSNTVDADAQRRSSVSGLIGSIREASASEEGAPNWFSGRKLPAGLYYCPVSLAFQPRVERVSASGKFSLRWTWDGDRLRAIIPSFEKGAAATGERPIGFTYDARVPHAIAVESEQAQARLSADPDDLLRNSNVLLLNNPLVDPAMLERLTGKQVTAGVAGNRFFHPFVWERPYYFALQYDEQGRVRTARQLPDRDGPGRTPVVLDFEWDGLRLTSIKGYQAAEGSSGRTLVYTRTPQYQQDRLVGEEIKAGSKTSKIKYVWKGDQLVSAECEKDESLDNRSREVFFLGAAAKARGR